MFYIVAIMLPSLALALWAQWRVKSAYARTSQIAAASGLSGSQAAAKILLDNGIDYVKIEESQGLLSDHYDPRDKVVRLSRDVFHGRSLASLGIAAHEVGHALQDAQKYSPLVLRNAIVPAASIGSWLSLIVIMAGFLLNAAGLILIGVLFFSAIVLFQIINLPCEFNASSRARALLTTSGMVTQVEDKEVGRVLNAAALTYVAAAVSSILNLFYYIMVYTSMAGNQE